MTSTRLPGKTLMNVNNKPALEIMVERVKEPALSDNIIIATTINREDDAIVHWCEKNKIKYFRGSEHNVYERVLRTHKKFNTDIVVELTGDCILIEGSLIDQAIKKYLDNDYDYLALSYPAGMGVQVYSLKTLESISKDRELEYQDREHVTPYLYTSGKYNIFREKVYTDLNCPELMIELDTMEDWQVINNVCKNFNDFKFSFQEIVRFAEENPEKIKMNSKIKRKGLS
jgi:spore coat polysaccharide biosynthesis protein SpsF